MFRRLFRRVIGDYPCRTFVEAVTDYLEGAMAPGEHRRFERHIGRCDGCERYLAQIRTTIAMTGWLTTRDVDALGSDARTALLGAFRDFHAGRRG